MTAIEQPPFILQAAVTVRPATREDLGKLEWFGQFTHFRRLMHRAFREQIAGRRLILVADFNGFPVGQVVLQLESTNGQIADGVSRAYLYSFRVMEMFQGMGIGTYLLHQAEALLIERGFRYVTLSVAKENSGAYRLYRRSGYYVIGDDPGHWSYIDQYGIRREVVEPCRIMEKFLITRH